MVLPGAGLAFFAGCAKSSSEEARGRFEAARAGPVRLVAEALSDPGAGSLDGFAIPGRGN